MKHCTLSRVTSGEYACKARGPARPALPVRRRARFFPGRLSASLVYCRRERGEEAGEPEPIFQLNGASARVPKHIEDGPNGRHLAGNGRRGVHRVDLVRAILERGRRTRVLDNFLTGFRENLDEVRDDIDLVEGDIRDPQTCRRAGREP